MAVPEYSKIKAYHRLLEENVEPKDYPWRFIDDPYKVLVSEFMLHRTRADQVVPVYEAFIERYTDIEGFVQESDEAIFDKLKSLGLYWRIHGLIRAVNQLYEKYKRIPVDYDALIEIAGIGPYIAGAVVCFAGDQPVPLIDTNTVRVVGRVFGLDLTGEARRRKEIKETISATTPDENPREYYYCVIDMAHDLCHSKTPECSRCPLIKICEFANNPENNSIDNIVESKL